MVYLTGSNADKNFSGGYELWIQKRYRICSFNMESAERRKKISICYDPTLSGAAEHSEAYFLDQGIGALTSINSEGEEKIFLYFGEKRIIGFSGILAHKYQYIHAKSLIAPPAPLLDYRQDKTVSTM